MVHYHRYHQPRKASEFVKDEESQNLVLDCSGSGYYRRTRPKLLSFLFLISFLSCCYVLAPLFLRDSFTFSLLYSPGTKNDGNEDGVDVNASSCSSVSSGTICCDRSGHRSDICVMKGDIRTHSASSSIFLYNSISTNNVSRAVDGRKDEEDQLLQHEKIKPYTRKWETSVMDTIDELNLISKKVKLGNARHCDVQHDVPAVFFSNGGYTGNVYHEFNDGIIPLYITSQHFNKKVVFVILEYHNWWLMKYGDILSHLSDFPAIDFRGDNRTHCFPEAIVGLRIHDELTVDSALMEGNKGIADFRNLLDRAYWPRIRGLIQDEEKEAEKKLREQISSSPSSETSQQEYIKQEVQENTWKKPKLVILSRSGSRAITNENLLVKMAEEIGFFVEVLKPGRTTELAKIYRVLNGSDVMIGVHGAAMTHFLFLRPGSVFIQVVPLGTTWAAETYYGEPARKLGLKYIGYEIHPRESSLYESYDKNDPILRDPASITKKGWEYTKKIYLDSQNVRLDLKRFRKRLHRAYEYKVSKSNLNVQHQPL
ncbi:xylan glycosyltransferase MUCI21-like isoform X1 [Gastrolobium bilobum]|uniref:xylan glycosyltransferase MUCI21-like isoform X1 n=1 Tax=Gastrolobium bilobum TaxID=150636 RepID=UPI002AAF1172|nr:xylan glycosyltransferase MUCI21-like isoform X1 [Gastrolobium bilobum]